MTGEIAPLQPGEWERVAEIYREGIESGNATFETSPPSWEKWDAAHLPTGRLVARVGGRIAGWAALSPVSDRCVYAGVAEMSVYVAADARGRGVGRALLAAAIEAAERAGIWTPVPRNGNSGGGAPAACGGYPCRAPGFDAVVHRARGATQRSFAMRRRPSGSGGAGQSAVLPRLDDGKPSPSSRRLAAYPAALRTPLPLSPLRGTESGTFPENAASIALQKACGFREVGRRERLGKMRDGRWRDVILLERRSRVAGTD